MAQVNAARKKADKKVRGDSNSTRGPKVWWGEKVMRGKGLVEKKGT